MLTEQQKRALDNWVDSDPALRKNQLDAQIRLGTLLHLLTRGFLLSTITVADAIGGATTTVVDLTLFGPDGRGAGSVLFEMAAFDDSGVSTPATNATLGTASIGSIVSGSGTAAIKGRTDSSGRFRCVLTNAVDETNWLATSATFGGPAIDGTAIADATFSA
jgi:hypothetical protein